MVAVNEAVSVGLSLALGLKTGEDLPNLCRGGDSISFLRLFHYFPYENGPATDSECVAGVGGLSGVIESDVGCPAEESPVSSFVGVWVCGCASARLTPQQPGDSNGIVYRGKATWAGLPVVLSFGVYLHFFCTSLLLLTTGRGKSRNECLLNYVLLRCGV